MKRRLKNPRIAKWLALFGAFMRESMQKRRPFHTKRPSISRRHRDKKTHLKWYRFTTQTIRKEITRGLGELYDLALEFGKDEALEMKEREKWSRLAAYVAQTINTIIGSHDELKIEETLDEMKQYVKTNLEEQ